MNTTSIAAVEPDIVTVSSSLAINSVTVPASLTETSRALVVVSTRRSNVITSPPVEPVIKRTPVTDEDTFVVPIAALPPSPKSIRVRLLVVLMKSQQKRQKDSIKYLWMAIFIQQTQKLQRCVNL